MYSKSAPIIGRGYELESRLTLRNADSPDRKGIGKHNASLGVQRELDRRRDRLKKDMEYILKIAKKFGKWTQHPELKRDVDEARSSIEKVITHADNLLDEFFEGV